MYDHKETKIKDLQPGDRISLFGLDNTLTVSDVQADTGDFVWLAAASFPDKDLSSGPEFLQIRVDRNATATRLVEQR